MALVILDSPSVDARTLGWEARPEGLCRGERCVPIATDEGRVDVRAFAERLGMPLVCDAAGGLWALGPEGGGRALASASVPDLVLPDREGRAFDLASLRGTKVLLVAWASW